MIASIQAQNCSDYTVAQATHNTSSAPILHPG